MLALKSVMLIHFFVSKQSSGGQDFQVQLIRGSLLESTLEICVP